MSHEARLFRLWESEPGLRGFFSSVDHKQIGLRYIVTALVFLALGGLEALVMRLQLAGPDRSLLTPEQYDQLFSTHGMTMIFLYAVARFCPVFPTTCGRCCSAAATWRSRG